MSKATAPLQSDDLEGHGEDAPKPTVKKGTFTGIGTYAPLSDSPISVNKKSGGLPSGE